MQKRLLPLLVGGLISLLFLAACGSTTTTSTGSGSSSTSPTATTASGSSSTNSTPTVPPMATVTSGNDPMTNSLKGLSGKDFEIKFMQEMIVHHQSATQMAQLVPAHTKRQELITLSQNIITAQNKEISEITTWLSQWYHEKPLTNSMSVPGMSEMPGEMNTLNQAQNATFDKLFMTMMTSHHQEAINMANLLPTKTQRPELLKLGQNIVTSQSAEIQQMKGWQQEWFKS
jgi:uncharacterized protein (DUF305 family)